MTDLSRGFVVSIAVHVLVFMIAGATFLTPPKYQMDSGVAVSLVAGPVATSRAVVEPEPVSPASKQEGIPSPVQPVAKPQGDGSSKEVGNDVTTAKAGPVITTQAHPSYLDNPAPVYPDAAKRRGQEGVVLVEVGVDASGRATRVELKKSSGVGLLDAAAVKAVKTWKFKPALMGSVPVASVVVVPVRFRLD